MILGILFISPRHPLLPSDLDQAPEADRVGLLADRVKSGGSPMLRM